LVVEEIVEEDSFALFDARVDTVPMRAIAPIGAEQEGLEPSTPDVENPIQPQETMGIPPPPHGRVPERVESPTQCYSLRYCCYYWQW
jgi:hypothetical protein